MATPTVSLPIDFQASAPGASMIGPNVVVAAAAGVLATAADVLTFADGSPGNWTQGDVNVTVAGGNPTVSATGVGTSVNAQSGVTVPVVVISGDPNVSTS
ncbi:MAG TPA: hypothetical protein VHO06_27310 [Polyangia bacterium]|nr:hypothetical protein [Polyangia bacterium]